MKYPIRIQNFEGLRKDNYVYVDKTDLIYKLVNEGKYYFLSRPRRFGKSLLISTLDAYLSGKKELFEGLAISQMEKDWNTYPILHLDLNSQRYDTLDDLKQILDYNLTKWEGIYGDEDNKYSFSLRFSSVVEKASKKAGKGVVILVDEYDKPLLQTIANKDVQDAMRSELKAFYSVLKSLDQYIKFAFLTGVTKFGKVSVFSDLNNLIDLSLDDRYQTLCGITEGEIHQNFEEPVKELAANYNKSYEETLAQLKKRYDGYHFVEHGKGMYNPFSLLNTLAKGKFGNYWFETGTPTYLVELMKNTNYPLSQMTKEEVSSDFLNSIDSASVNPIPVIYQSGYLTIKDYDEEFDCYQLGFPNQEVEEGFTRFLLPFYTQVEAKNSAYFVGNFVKELRAGKVDEFMQRMQTMFDDTDYKIAGDMELYFQNAFYLISRMLGFYTEVERSMSNGRMDMIIKTSDYIYIFEFKLDKSADEALAQIEEKGYVKPFVGDARKLYKIGVNFSKEKRSIDDWKAIC